MLSFVFDRLEATRRFLFLTAIVFVVTAALTWSLCSRPRTQPDNLAALPVSVASSSTNRSAVLLFPFFILPALERWVLP